jgi:hypothetical protein
MSQSATSTNVMADTKQPMTCLYPLRLPITVAYCDGPDKEIRCAVINKLVPCNNPQKRLGCVVDWIFKHTWNSVSFESSEYENIIGRVVMLVDSSIGSSTHVKRRLGTVCSFVPRTAYIRFDSDICIN